MDFLSSDKLIEPERGDLLLAVPYLTDSNFFRKVVFICEHTNQGTMGFVLNDKSSLKLADFIEITENFDIDIYNGGPVKDTDYLGFIHREPALANEKCHISSGIYAGGDSEKLLQLINLKSMPQENIRFFYGCSSWEPNQLMEEILAKTWIVLKRPVSEMIFDWDNQKLWEMCLKSKGGKFKIISRYPKNLSLN